MTRKSMPSWLPMSWRVQICGWFKAATVAGFALKPLLQVRIGRDVFGQHLDGDRAVQAGVGGFVDLAHPPSTEARFDLVWAEGGAGG